MNKLLVIAASLSVLAACSDESGKAEIKQILECSMAAKLVGQASRIDAITEHANWASAKSGYKPDYAQTKQMHDEIKAKWNLKSMPRHDQDVLLVGVYNSKTCRALHRGDPISAADVPPDA